MRRDGKLVSPYFTNFVWKPGQIFSTATGNPVTKTRNISRGIHVFRERKKAKAHFYEPIVEVVCKVEDLIGANSTQMVFKKVTLTKVEYAKHVTKLRKAGTVWPRH